jgi:hypothetical protein
MSSPVCSPVRLRLRVRDRHCHGGSAPAAGSGCARGAGLQILDFKPAFDDLMTMLVQPRHTKLWLAAQQQNGSSPASS